MILVPISHFSQNVALLISLTTSACSFSCKTSSFPSSSLLVSFSGNVGSFLLVVTCTSDRHGGGLWEVRLICLRACGCGIHTRSRFCLFCWPGHAPAGKNLIHTLCIVPKFVVCVVVCLRSIVNFEALNTVYWHGLHRSTCLSILMSSYSGEGIYDKALIRQISILAPY